MQLVRSLACVAMVGLMTAQMMQDKWGMAVISAVFAAFWLWRLVDVAASTTKAEGE